MSTLSTPRLSTSRLSAARLALAKHLTATITLEAAAAFLFRLAVSSFLLSPPAAAVQNPHAQQLLQVNATATKKAGATALVPIVAPPGSGVYVAQRGDSIPSVARKYLKRTKFLTSAELAEAIHAANQDLKGTFLKPGEQIIIPGILEAAIVEKSVPVARDFEVRAIYLTGVMAGSDHGMRIIRHWKEVGGNAVVFDIKDSDGIVNIAFDNPLATGQRHYIPDLPKFVHFLHSENMHAIARIAIFRDERMVVEHPELAVKSKKTGQPWRENGKLVWTDSSNPKVQDYNIALAKFVAQSGADEIQFDYVRFPAEGDQKDASFVFQTEQAVQDSVSQLVAENKSSACSEADAIPGPAPKGQKNAAHGVSRGTDGKNQQSPMGRKTACSAPPRTLQRSDVIVSFLKKAYAELHPTGVLLSLDVFGVMAWQRPVDLSHTGQDIVGMAKYCDVLSPMIYPSHFFGMDNIEHPGDAPEHFIGESMQRFELITKGSGVVIRPWLQAFRWRTKTYSPEYIKVQVATAKEKGGIGFLFWNAANDYSKPYEAMPEMRAADLKEGSKDKAKFFRGDELPGVTIKASVTPAAVAATAEAGSH